MTTNGEALDQVKVAEKILWSLSIKFHTKKTVLEAIKDLRTLTLDDLEGELVTYEMSLNQQTTQTVDEALQEKVNQPKEKEEKSNLVETNQRGHNFRGKGRGGRGDYRGHGRGNFSYQQRNDNNFRKEQQSNQKFQRRDKSKVQCYNCGKYGHYQCDCWYNESENREEQAKMVENYRDKQETLLFSSSATEENKGNEWFIDSGCSNHMYGNKELFVDLDESFKAMVRLGNNARVPAV
ncbi:uncharacterized protein LOC132611845 [Lycium barbarum]|uniref:uncharacterized protein LOC132611845 n=1 Tax=Lycium barbarum TaxID=112863 RepID=UPI00293E7EF9|nr:uncharacterized protein LOC132611845 [Lycium barbarum]